MALAGLGLSFTVCLSMSVLSPLMGHACPGKGEFAPTPLCQFTGAAPVDGSTASFMLHLGFWPDSLVKTRDNTTTLGHLSDEADSVYPCSCKALN